MANLTGNNPIGEASDLGRVVQYPAAAVKSYFGGAAMVVLGTGLATPLVVTTPGAQFIGVYGEPNDNSAAVSTNSNGTYIPPTNAVGNPTYVPIITKGVFKFGTNSVTPLASWIGQYAYFLDDNNITIVPGTYRAGVIKTIDQASGLVHVDITTATMSTTSIDSQRVTAVPLALVNTNGTGGTAQVIAQLSLPANTLTVGTRLKFRAAVSSTVHPGSETFALTLTFGSATGANGTNISGGTTIATAPATTNTVANLFYIEGELLCTAIGTSGGVVAVGITSAGTQAANAPHAFSLPVGSASPAASTINTTIAQNFTVAGNFSTSADSSAVALIDFAIDLTRP